MDEWPFRGVFDDLVTRQLKSEIIFIAMCDNLINLKLAIPVIEGVAFEIVWWRGGGCILYIVCIIRNHYPMSLQKFYVSMEYRLLHAMMQLLFHS